ncbi:unnamed protein product [Ixodes pacificus]
MAGHIRLSGTATAAWRQQATVAVARNRVYCSDVCLDQKSTLLRHGSARVFFSLDCSCAILEIGARSRIPHK